MLFLFFRYFYHGYVTIDVNNAEGVVEVARFFHIEWLIHVSRHFLVCHLAFEDYSLALALADQYVLGDARAAILSFIGNSFYQLMTKPRFLRLQFEALNDLLSGEWYIAATEGTVLQAINSWLKLGREHYRIPLLKRIHLPLLETDELKVLEDQVPQIVEDPELSKMMVDAQEYHSVPSNQCLITSSRTSARGARPYLVIYSGVEDSSLAEYRPLNCNPDQSTDIIHEEVMSSFLESVFEFAAVAVLGDCMFIAGGYNREMLSTSLFYCYSPHRRCWTELSSMQYARVSHSLVAADSLGLYAITGVNHYFDNSLGLDRDKILDTIEFYNPRENLWVEMPLMPFGVFNTGAAFVDNRLYVTGGISDNPEYDVPVGHVYCCQPSDDGWTILANMNHARHSHALVAVRHKLYVFGGLTAGDDTMGFVNCMYNEVYDIETDQWTDLTPVPPSFGRIHSQSLAIANNVILLSSHENEGYFLSEFDVEADKLEAKATNSCGTCVHKMVVFETAFPSTCLKDFILAPI